MSDLLSAQQRPAYDMDRPHIFLVEHMSQRVRSLRQ